MDHNFQVSSKETNHKLVHMHSCTHTHAHTHTHTYTLNRMKKNQCKQLAKLLTTKFTEKKTKMNKNLATKYKETGLFAECGIKTLFSCPLAPISVFLSFSALHTFILTLSPFSQQNITLHEIVRQENGRKITTQNTKM